MCVKGRQIRGISARRRHSVRHCVERDVPQRAGRQRRRGRRQKLQGNFVQRSVTSSRYDLIRVYEHEHNNNVGRNRPFFKNTSRGYLLGTLHVRPAVRELRWLPNHLTYHVRDIPAHITSQHALLPFVHE